MIWYEEEVQRVEQEIKKLSYQPRTLFYGSSSIRMWEEFYKDFKFYYPVNLGFGGSTLEACVFYFQRIMEPYNPQHIIIYAGDNDLGDGKKPDEVHNCFGKITVSYISVKPSLARWEINNTIQYTNALIKQTIDLGIGNMYFVDVYNSMIGKDELPLQQLYAEDGLHLSKEGYDLWKTILLTHISSIDDSSLISSS
jgi:lysophospholipase L1-like esterase